MKRTGRQMKRSGRQMKGRGRQMKRSGKHMKGSGRQASREPDHKHPAWETNEKNWETNERKWETSRPGTRPDHPARRGPFFKALRTPNSKLFGEKLDVLETDHFKDVLKIVELERALRQREDAKRRRLVPASHATVCHGVSKEKDATKGIVKSSRHAHLKRGSKTSC